MSVKIPLPSSRRLVRRMSMAVELGMRMIRCFSIMAVELLLSRTFVSYIENSEVHGARGARMLTGN